MHCFPFFIIKWDFKRIWTKQKARFVKVSADSNRTVFTSIALSLSQGCTVWGFSVFSVGALKLKSSFLQPSAVQRCRSVWCGGSCHVRVTPSICAAPGVMSSWSKPPTTAAQTTRYATPTPSRWKTLIATSRMPIKSYLKGKSLFARHCL